MIKIGDRLKYIGYAHISDRFEAKGGLCTVNNILRNGKLRVKFDHPKSIGCYRIYDYNFVGMCGFIDKRIMKHKFIK